MVRPRTALLVLLLTSAPVAGCRSEPEPAGELTPTGLTVIPTGKSQEERVRPDTSGEPAEIQARRLAQVEEIVRKLQDGKDRAPEERPGAGEWRAAEIDKVRELVVSACRAADPPCMEVLKAVAAGELPADELWGVYGSFLNELKPRAHIGALGLGRSLLLSEDGATRDRAFRIAVGSGAARRGQFDDLGRRATTIPLRPAVGEPVLVVYEMPSPCPDLEVAWKGPDPSGRVDMDVRIPCPPLDLTGAAMPVNKRAVWTREIDALPMGGLEVWMKDAEQPLLVVAPREVEQDAGKDGG